MGKIWTDENKFRIWLEVELLACDAQAELGGIPRGAAQEIRKKAAFDLRRIEEIEREVQHDVIAFLTNVGESVGPAARFIHLGLTSSDVLDTTLAVQMKQSADIILDGLNRLVAVLGKRAVEFKHVAMVGRTHGVHAEPITFGLKLALWFEEVKRQVARMNSARHSIAVGQISGAVGTYAHVGPSVEGYVCEKLGLRPASISTQVLQRDRHAEFLNTLALIGCTLEKMATEIRHLQKTEVLEAEEYFSKGQKGSSAMPHKRNPITCERIAGLSRILRGNALAGMENVALWHERDISHSSVERVIIPDSCIVADYMIAAATNVIDRLVVHPENMERNLSLTKGLIFSESVLVALTKKGMNREEAYRIVQQHAMDAWRTRQNFRDLLKSDDTVKKLLSVQELDELFDVQGSLKNVDVIFQRVGLS